TATNKESAGPSIVIFASLLTLMRLKLKTFGPGARGPSVRASPFFTLMLVPEPPPREPTEAARLLRSARAVLQFASRPAPIPVPLRSTAVLVGSVNSSRFPQSTGRGH